MFVRNSNQQLNLDDPLLKLPKYLQNVLVNSWAHVFQEKIFPTINEDRFRVLYSSDEASRPNTPVNVSVGLLIIKELFQMIDEEVIGSLHFDIRFQYALRTTSYDRQPASINTLSNFRKRLSDYFEETGIDLIQQEIEAQAKIIGKELNIDGKNYRMDSLMVSASCKKLNRISLIFHTNEKCVNFLSKKYPNLITEELKIYKDKGYKQEILYRTNYESLEEKTLDLLKHSLYIKRIYDTSELRDLLESEAYEIIERLVSENLSFEDSGEINLVPSKNLLPTSMQSHTDPDATFRTKYGPNIGYVANVAERYDKDHCIIEYYDYQKNVYSDIKFSEDTVEKLHFDSSGLRDENEFNPINLVVDAAYYGHDLANEALNKGVKLYPTDLVGKKKNADKMGYIEFEVDRERDCIIKCPNGKKPVITELRDNKKPMYYAKFNKADCKDCKKKKRCPHIKQKAYNCVKVLKQQYYAEGLREIMKSDEYFEIVRHRAAIEGIPSVLRRRYHVDNMPVRRFSRTKIWFGFKIAAINIKRLIKYELCLT